MRDPEKNEAGEHTIFSGHAVRLEDLLTAREERVKRQDALMQHYHCPVICLTLVMPGPVKDSPALREIFKEGKMAVKAALSVQKWQCLFEETYLQQTGPEAFYVVSAPPQALKRCLVEVETSHPMGRLWDSDVVVPGFDFSKPAGGYAMSKPLSRQDLGLPPRKCLICDHPAAECARSRAHDLTALYEVVASLASLERG